MTNVNKSTGSLTTEMNRMMFSRDLKSGASTDQHGWDDVATLTNRLANMREALLEHSETTIEQLNSKNKELKQELAEYKDYMKTDPRTRKAQLKQIKDTQEATRNAMKQVLQSRARLIRKMKAVEGENLALAREKEYLILQLRDMDGVPGDSLLAARERKAQLKVQRLETEVSQHRQMISDLKDTVKFQKHEGSTVAEAIMKENVDLNNKVILVCRLPSLRLFPRKLTGICAVYSSKTSYIRR